jgi:hypothetical protein
MIRLASVMAILCIARVCIAGEAGRDPSSPPPSKGFVSREEYEVLLRDQQSLRAELQALKQKAAVTPAPASQDHPTAPSDTEVDEAIQGIRRDIRQLQQFRPGFDQFLIAGDAQFGFNSFRHNNSSFSAAISPLFLWKPADKLLIETAFDVGISTDRGTQSSSTSFDLTIANASYELDDYMVIGGGLFVVPFGVYHNHFDPPWINKLPDDPLAFSDGGVAPSSEVGIFARGAVPAGTMKLTYDVYLTNGPTLITNSPDSAGSLNFHDFTDLNGNKAVGGRIGIIPIPEMEAGYSFQASEPNPDGFHRAHALLQAVDLNYRPQINALRGVIDLRAEYAWSNLSSETFDPTGALKFGPIRFKNHRSGGYVQVAYRPTMIENKIIRRLELVGRYDFLTTPIHSPGGEHENRFTIGLDYWLAPNAVFKIAYEFDQKRVGQRQDGLIAQFGIGL